MGHESGPLPLYTLTIWEQVIRAAVCVGPIPGLQRGLSQVDIPASGGTINKCCRATWANCNMQTELEVFTYLILHLTPLQINPLGIRIDL